MKVNAQLCGTETPQNYQTYENQYPSLTSNVQETFCINVVFRIVRNDDGSNGYDTNNIPLIMDRLNQLFNPHRILIYQKQSFDYINNSVLNNNTGVSNLTLIPNAINIYLVSNLNYAGISSSIPGNRITIRKGALFTNSNTLAHELGHCLGLLHTHECSYYLNPPPYVDLTCAENPSIIDCNNGDKICDTPADPYTTPQQYLPYNLNLYNPDKTNLMSYYLDVYHDHFTQGQGQRMRSTIQGSPILQSIRSNQCAAIDGANYICSTGTNVFSIAAFGSPLTLNWTVTGNLQIVGSATGSSITLQSTNPDNTGSATITVTINGSIVKTKTITIGPPLNNNNHVIGFYDWVSTNYGNMGLVAPTNPSITSFRWEIIEDPDFPINCSQSYKPRFIGSLPNDPYTYSSNTNQAVINWGSCTGSYMIVCYALNDCGETMYDYRYTDVGNPKNNPCYKNTVHTVVAPNPVRDKQINLVVNKTIQSTPCNWRSLYEPQYFNRKLDQINNSVSVYDFDGNLIFNKVYDTDEFTIREINIRSGNNYIVNLFTNEGGFTQQVIIVE